MISPKDVHSLSEFQRNAKKMLKELKKSKRPALLTVNGKGAVVVQDAAAYESLVSQQRLAADIKAVGEAIAYGGQPRPVHEVFDELDRELKAARPKRRRRTA
jgi:prevent-host-death family protein